MDLEKMLKIAPSRPLSETISENKREQFLSRLIRAAFLAGEFGFGGDEATFVGGFEDGGAVAFELGLDLPQRRHPCLQPRELLLNPRYDPPLLVSGWKWNIDSADVVQSQANLCRTTLEIAELPLR